MTMMESGKYNLESIITHEFSLADISQAIITAGKVNEALNVVIKWADVFCFHYHFYKIQYHNQISWLSLLKGLQISHADRFNLLLPLSLFSLLNSPRYKLYSMY